MRERTPSADDTPTRAPPAPSREAVSTDVAGSETPNDDTVEGYRTAKLSGIPSSSDRMVASTQSLEDLGVSHPANVTGSNADHQQQQQQQQQLQERYGHAYRSTTQTAQDKRSRLSNVINNLRKKVPDGAASGNSDSPRKEEDDRNSVERNLETLEKYVMTVLNGVIKDDEEEDKNAEKTKELERQRKGADEDEEEEEEEDRTDTAIKSESSSEGDIEAAVVPRLEDSSTVGNAEDAESSETTDCSNTKETTEESSEVRSQDSKEPLARMEEERLDVEEKESSEDDQSVPREKKENRTLGTIIMDRLSEHQVEERANIDDGRGNRTHDEQPVLENIEMQTICGELLNDLLSDVYRTIEDRENQQKVEECEKSKKTVDATESRIEETKDSSINVQELSMTGLHCSLPLDKVASVLQNCQTSESVTSRLSSESPSGLPSLQKSKPSSSTPPIRLLCLYCDRKFLSMSLRQRHTERAHQLGGGRRSERNLRKPSQNCQYCSEKCADTLEALFHHMVGSHGDKYHACVQCSTRYPTREALVGHMSETHGGNVERISQVQSEKTKEGASPYKEFCSQNPCEKMNMSSIRERRSEENESEDQDESRQSDSSRTKLIAAREPIDNPASPEFDSSFYSNVSCNIRENLLHHLDGKLQTMSGPSSSTCTPPISTSGTAAVATTTESKSPQQQPQQSYYEHSINQIQFPIDISLTAATPVYTKDYSASEEYENSSEYARKAGKTSSGSRPRRVSFEKYNFPRKYDGREQWTCSIKDLSKFDISTQLSLRKKQQLIKERLTISRLHQIPLVSCETTEVSFRDQERIESVVETAASNQDNADAGCVVDADAAILDVVRCDLGEPLPSETKKETTTESSATSSSSSTIITEFTIDFADFMRLRRHEEGDNELANAQKIVYAELSGEWSRTRIYICGACGSRHVTLKEMEDHKASTHPRVLCSHFELTGDQREYYKHLYLPGRDAATDAARNAILAEMVCTKCAKSCPNVGELHRHMLECGGDQAWLLGLTGSGKKKCKWRPFGSRSRRRRQRGMKRNIQNSQTQPRVVNMERPKEKQASTGPRVRPSDLYSFTIDHSNLFSGESIQKMLANLPAKRATRKVLQDSMMRSQGRLRNVQTRTRPRMIGDNSCRISRNKAALRNKLLKNAKSIQRNRCRSDNITAVIESVVRKCHEIEKKSDSDGDKSTETKDEDKKDAKEISEGSSRVTSKTSDQNDRTVRPRVVGRPKVLGKRRNVKNPQLQSKSGNKLAKAMGKFVKFKNGTTSGMKGEGEETSSPKSTPKNAKTPRAADKDDASSDSKKMSTISGIKNKNKSMQGILKRKRIVDPVASLNASIKAKSQLRTQDGKFARNPNKGSPAKLSETKTDDEKHKIADSIEIKPKPKAMQKLRKAEIQLPRRITRLSSDSDKMPTLEPVVQIVSSNEEYADKSTNDLPILSPVTSSGSPQDQKTSRISTKCVLKEKENNVETNADLEAIPEKSKKEQKSTRGRKPKEETKVMGKRKKTNTVEENKVSKNNVAVLKEDRTKRRKSLPVISTNSGENSKEEMSKGETIAKKDSRSKKEEMTKETRSNSKTRVDKDSVKSFEVKKLLHSATMMFGLDMLDLVSNDSKRNLRQSMTSSEILQMSDKSPQELDDESNGSKDTSKKEKIETTRKSSRKNVEKKSDDMAKTSLEKDSASNAIANATQNEKNQQDKRDKIAKAKESVIDNPDIEGKIDIRQTRESLSGAKSAPSLEITSDNFRKGSGLLRKRRNRNRSVGDEETDTRASEEQSSENIASNEKKAEKELEEVIDKVCKKGTEGEGDKNSDDRLDSTVVNINLSHLQSETSNLSVDSGKENSLETSVNVHSKLKVGRPRKTWDARREKSSRKRSLNNVIGILTEGMNIPVEAQQSVQVLTVQTSLDNPDRARNGSSQQTNGGEGNVIAVDSAFSELSVLAKSEEESAENEAVTSTTDGLQEDDEKNARACSDEAQIENAFADGKVDVSLKVATAKTCHPTSPANDIILDLSRRKPKGKGSFLEKIVSKIAKQKDALLEGEVGSLLDTAADELTSILDEVGPTLADNAENANSNKANNASKNDKDVTVTSTDKELPTIVNSEIRTLETDKNVESAVSNHSTDSLEISDNLKESLGIKTETQSENQTKVDNVPDIEMKNVDKKMNDAMRSAEELHIESCENKSITNKEAVIPIEISDENPASLIGKENLEKLERKEGVTKSRRKSNKRSLQDANCSKRSKKRSLEIVEDRIEEDVAQKEIQLNDIVTFKPKDASDVGNEFSKKDDNIMETSNADTEVEEIQHSESEMKDDLKPLNLEKNLTKESNDESNLEKITNLPEVAENVKLTMNLEESSLNKIISDEAVVTNVQSTDSIEKSADFSTSSEKSVECGKSVDKIQKKDKTDMSEPSSRRTSKRKSQPILSVTPPINAAKNVLQTSIKSIETEEKPSSSISAKEQSLESDMQPIKIGTTTEDSGVLLEEILYSAKTVSGKHKEIQNTDDSSLVNLIPSKITKKRGAKKKSLADEHLELPEDKLVEVAPKLDDESSMTDEQLSVSLEHFKIPEVKDLPQSAKKRGPKKKSQPEDGRWNGGSVPEESRVNEEPTEPNEMSNLIEEKVEEQEETEKHVIEKDSSTKKLERSSSSGSIGLISSSTKTRSMFKKKTQLSSEDFADSSIRSQGAESTDDLSESSCVSESSYFRKKRFAKKKRKEETLVDDSARADTSCVDSTALKSDKQNLKRKTSKSKSLLDEYFDLPDANIVIPMDIRASLETIEAFERGYRSFQENIEREVERELAKKSSDLQNEETDKPMDDTVNKDSYATLEQPASNNHDSPDNPVTPKKRAAGNFVVVHTKTGEILIVEKRKKLTKEAARFFCDVCATSFTRKSSLKKHTLSQSHLSQLTKSTKDKIESNSNTENAEEDDNEWKSNQENNQQIKSVPDDTQPHEIEKFLESDENYVPYATSAESTKSLVDFGTTRQMLEDELLDEEICKITENMSHDEYVLTDHITPEELESTTPIKPVPKKQEDSDRGRNGDKKRNKSKKKNLAEEHLLLDSPELEKSKIKSDELPKPINDVVRVSLPSCDRTSAKEKVEKIEDVSEKCEDIAETKNQSELIVKSSNEETDCSKSICDIDAKAEQQAESTRTTRRTRKLSKMDNEGKEKIPVSTETNRFSLRPRRSKNIQLYEEFEAAFENEFEDDYTLDNTLDISNISKFYRYLERRYGARIPCDEIKNNCDTQKRQNEWKEVEEETNRNALQKKTHADTKDPQDAEVTKSKTDSTNDAKKRKHTSAKEKVEKIEDVSEKCEDIAETKNQSELIVKSSNEETDCSKSICDIDAKAEQQAESTRTTRRTRKLSKMDNEGKEKTPVSTETNRFSLRPRRSKNIQLYEEFEAFENEFEDDYTLDNISNISKFYRYLERRYGAKIPCDEIKNNCDTQKRQNEWKEVEEETNRNALQKKTHADTKDPQDAEVTKSKTDSTNDAKKRKRTSAKEKVEKIEDVSEKCEDIAETKNQSELIVKSSNEETDCSKSICDIDAKAEQQAESTRTTRRTRKLSKMDNEGKEETPVSTETNRFSLKPRRSKNIQLYEEFEAFENEFEDDYTLDNISNISKFYRYLERRYGARIPCDEIKNNCDTQKRQNEWKEVEEETNRNASQEKTHADTKDPQDAEVTKSKTDSTNDAKKRKRGRPRLKNRIVSNSGIELEYSAHAKSEVNGNDAVAAGNLDESKIKDQKLDLHTKERLDRTGKAPHIDANAQPKRRGRPRKNRVAVANNSSVQADNSSASESTKSNDDEVKKKTGVIESRSETIEEIASGSSLLPNAESSPAVQDHTPESSLSETTKDLLNAEEVRSTELSVSEDQPAQRMEPADIKTGDTVLANNCEDMLTFNIPSKKDEISMPSEVNTCVDDTECILEDKRNDDTSVNVLMNVSTTESLAELPSQITEQVPIDDLRSVESKAIELDESFEVQKLSDVSEEKQTKSGEKLPKEEEVPEAKLSGSENSEDEALVTDKSLRTNDRSRATDKSLSIAISHESQKTINDLENDSICDERAIRLESSSKKLSRKSTSKEREIDRKRLKTSRGKKKKVKVAELSSDSENEDDRIESAASSKSKIVKSVFGRVFGGEKADKVKEVLNDWVSRSEDDSDMSRSASEAKSCLRGPTKFSENGHKREKKYHPGSETKKDIERSPRKKGNDKCGSEVHGKAKNRKKREKDVDTMPEDCIGSPINPAKRRHRESKIRADEKILRTFDDESPTLSEYEEIKRMEDLRRLTMEEINNESNDKDKESRRYHEKELNKEHTKDKNLTSENWEGLRVDHDAHGKSKSSSGSRKKQDANERSSSPSQSNMFKYRRRESKTRAGERIWRAFDNEISSCLSDDQYLDALHGISNEQESEFYESKDLNRSDNLKSIKQKDDDAWKNTSSIDQGQTGVHSGRGKPRKDSNNRKRQDFNVIKISKTKTKRIPRDSDNESSIPSRDQETKNEMQNDQTVRSTSESRNRSKTLIKDSAYESFVYDDSAVSKHMNKDQDNLLAHLDWSTDSRKNKKGNEEWKRSSRKLEFDQEDDQPIEKGIGRKDEESAISSRSCSSLAIEEPVMKNQLIDFDGNSQTNRKSNGNDKEEEEEEEEEDDNDLGRQRMSPFYARETPDSSIESNSNEEEEEEEEEDGGEEEEEEEERITHEDNSRKTNPSEFSGEKIIIRSPSLGHRSDVVTIAPTDAIEDNALDVPREIESIAKPRQGKILNFDEELFVECCSRLKATSENELRGAKKIKLDHTESYHRRDDQPQGFRVNRDRWRDVESQNSLGSLLESVNQLLGEEMYNSHDRSYRTRGSERSSRSASPDASRVDNLGYEDSLDVAFEHNNKLRDKIQQRMRESENLIASTFGQKINDNDHPNDDKRDSVGNSYSSSIHEHEQLSTSIASNREQESSPNKNKMNSTLGGLHKALSNLLHSNGKHDNNGSTPMKLLAELACARAPTSTSPEDTTNSSRNHQSVKMVAAAVAAAAAAAAAVAGKDTPISPKRPTKDSTVTPKNSPSKKTRNPIKELFERKKEMNDRKEQERSRTALVEVNVLKQRKSKKNKKQQQFPLIRRSEHYGGLVEKKKRRDSLDRKEESERIKDVYEFDEEESQMAPTLGSVMSYRSQADKSYEINWSRAKNIDGDLDAVLENGKMNYVTDSKLDAMINRKFQELEKFAPKTKGALKSFQSEEQQQQQRVAESITGPMDEFVERKQQRIKRPMEQGIKQPGKIKKRGKSSKKRVRNAWYENDSSDEFRTAAKAEDVGVGISKSQRSCSKGKQNLFAELSTSSESEYERDEVDFAIANEQRPSRSRKILKKSLDVDVDEADDQRIINEPEFDNEDQITSDWNQVAQEEATKNDHDVAKSESEMSDHSLVIDERKMTDEARNSDDDADNQYERTFELDDLYREDSSDAETEVEENEELMTEEAKNRARTQALDESATLQTKLDSMNTKDDCTPENELISLEEALDLLDRHEDLDPEAENVHAKNNIVNGTMDEASNDDNEEMENKCMSPTEMRDEKEEPDDDVPALPEKLSSNEKPQKESDHNLPLHVFLSRKVQESKKRKQQQLDKLREEQERILMDFQPTRRQRKCAIGKQGLLAEISSSDEESYVRDNSRKGSDHDKSRKKRESKEKRKERYLEKKHEQMIAKEQKAIEEEILREVGKRKENLAHDDTLNTDAVETVVCGQTQKKKHPTKEKHKKSGDENIEENAMYIGQSSLDSSEENHNKSDRSFSAESTTENNGHSSTSAKRKKLSKSPAKSKKVSKPENGKIPTSKRSKEPIAEKAKKTSANNKDSKERRSSSGKRDSDDEELKTTKSWNKVEEGVGVAIGRRKRTAALQLYYWSSSSDEEEAPEPIPAPEEEEDDRQEQHGWIVGDSHKRMITMLAMEKQLKEKRRRSEDEFEPGKAKSKKHRNSTS